MIQIDYLGSSYHEFIEHLTQHDIQYNQRIKLSETQIAMETLQILVGSGGVGWVAKSLIDWLKHKNSVTFYYKQDHQEIKIENLTQQHLEHLLNTYPRLLLKEEKKPPLEEQE